MSMFDEAMDKMGSWFVDKIGNLNDGAVMLWDHVDDLNRLIIGVVAVCFSLYVAFKARRQGIVVSVMTFVFMFLIFCVFGFLLNELTMALLDGNSILRNPWRY